MATQPPADQTSTPAPAPAPRSQARQYLSRVPTLVHFAGLIGLVLLVWALAAVVMFRLDAREADACTPQGAAKGDAFQITGIEPGQVRLGGQLCVTVANVASATTLQATAKALTDAQAKLAAAQAALDAYRSAQLVADTPDPQESTRTDILDDRVTDAQTAVTTAQAAHDAARQPVTYALALGGETSPFDKQVATATAAPQKLVFQLTLSDDADTDIGAFWREALDARIADGKVATVLSLVPDGAAPGAPTASMPVTIQLYTPWFRWPALIGLALLLLWTGMLAAVTPMLRDGDSDTSSFSLSRVQMAFWFVLVTIGFVYIWIVTGQYLNVVHASTFALLGISGLTAGTAIAIDANKSATAGVSRGFFADLATDGDGHAQLHRLQMIAWTVILGGIFLWQFAALLELADFDANLLALAGIVNGVYVGLKTQE